jgi:hypothetical protein
MDEEGSRSSTNCESKSKYALTNQDAPLVNGRSEVGKVLEDKAVDPVVLKGISLAQDVVLHLLGEEMCLLHQDQLSLCMRNSVMEMLDRHAILFTSFAKRLACTPENTSEAFLGVSEELFLHGCVTWTRIIALYALAGRLALYYQENNMPKLARSIPQYMEHCIAGKIASFVNKNGGWVRARFYYRLPTWFCFE